MSKTRYKSSSKDYESARMFFHRCVLINILSHLSCGALCMENSSHVPNRIYLIQESECLLAILKELYWVIDCSLSASSTILEFCCDTFNFNPTSLKIHL